MNAEWTEFWELVGGAIALQSQAFGRISVSPNGTTIAILVVLLTGLSQTLGQCIVLFANRVKPLRFIFSVLVAAILFLFSYIFWWLSILIISRLLFQVEPDSLLVFRVLGLGYAPQLFEFLIALPYVGIPTGIVLSIWSWLATFVGINSLRGFTELEGGHILLCTGLGWIGLQVAQRTVGKPVTALGQFLLDVAAGTKLVKNRADLAEMIRTERPLQMSASPTPTLIESVSSLQEVPASRFRLSARVVAIALMGIIALGLFLLALREGISIWYAALDTTIQLTLGLIGVSLVGLVVSILLTPFEALSWWAGWYGEDPLSYSSELVEDLPDSSPVERYVLYLDGINQGTRSYLPNIEAFLDALAAALPQNVLIVKGIMSYSVRNQPLGDKQGPFALLWRIIDSIVSRNPRNPIGLFINLRNVAAVAVSADPRYGPIQNQGLAQVLFDSLMSSGYDLKHKPPITLIGYSGGGQMSMGAVPFLKQATGAPIDVISIAGVISGNTGEMTVERLYHLVGKQDLVEKLGPIMFPDRWPLYLLSYWNQAKRRGKIYLLSLGPVGHNGKAGPFSREGVLADGRTHFQQTLDLVTGLLLHDWRLVGSDLEMFYRQSNYERYMAAEFNRPSYYPVKQSLPGDRYHPLGTWMGRLILPEREARQIPRRVGFEVYHADADHQALVGQIVSLGWSNDLEVQQYVQAVMQDVYFSDQAFVSDRRGWITPTRLDSWQKVDPLESLAGAHPRDDVVVKLPEPVEVVEEQGNVTLLIRTDPVQITGRLYGLVTVVETLENDRIRVRHYDPQAQAFTGPEEVLLLPTVVSSRDGVMPSSNRELEASPLNAQGWYVYGAQNREGIFVVQAIAPRELLALHPARRIYGERETLHYINHDYWKNVVAQKGKISSVLLLPSQPKPVQDEDGTDLPIAVGDRLLLLHLFGGIGGENAEFAPLRIYFGHFAFGVAQVVQEPLTGEPRFAIDYRQIYTQNANGTISGTHDWTRYMGDRQFGHLGCRPISDILVKFPPLTEDYNFNGVPFSPLDFLLRELAVMAARYRTGDGTGTTFIGPINSCVQDSSQALYVTIKRLIADIQQNRLMMKWMKENPNHKQAQRFGQLIQLMKTLEDTLTPLRIVRPDWESGKLTLGQFPVETPLQTVLLTLASWRSLLPRLANDLLAMIFLQFGASVWVLRTNQVGGVDPTIEPIAPTDFSSEIPKVRRSGRSRA
jgi:predicted Abi (CAAX) family protease